MRAVLGVFDRLGIMIKALIPPVLLILIMLLVGGVALFTQQDVNRGMEEVSGDLAPVSEVATELMGGVYRERIAASDFLNHRADYMSDAWRNMRDDVLVTLERAGETIRHPERAAILRELVEWKVIDPRCEYLHHLSRSYLFEGSIVEFFLGNSREKAVSSVDRVWMILRLDVVQIQTRYLTR